MEQADEWVIQYDEINQCLYTSLFWPYMPMRCTAEDVFELISFPVEMSFEKDRQLHAVSCPRKLRLGL